jgi:YbbR domain-containing protein
VSFKSAITINRSLKVAAIVAALILWLLAKGEQTTGREFLLPLTLAHMPDGLTTVEPVPESVRVVLSGATKELLRLDLWGDPRAAIDLSGAEPDRTIRVTLSEGNIVLPRDSGVQVAEIRDPRVLDLEIDHVAERRVGVVAALSGTPAAGFHVLGDPLCIPDSVTVIGPARVVGRLSSVRTAPLELAGRESSIDASREIDITRGANLHAVPKEVRVSVDIEGSATRVLSGLPVKFQHEPGFASVTIAPETIEISLTGPAHIIAALSAADVSVVVDARGLPRGTHEIAPEIVLPRGVELVSAKPPRFAVTMR